MNDKYETKYGEAIDRLAELGFDGAQVEFSGGGDEGGADRFVAWRYVPKTDPIAAKAIELNIQHLRLSRNFNYDVAEKKNRVTTTLVVVLNDDAGSVEPTEEHKNLMSAIAIQGFDSLTNDDGRIQLDKELSRDEEDEPLCEMLEQPCDDQYGGYCCDGVSGTVLFDVAARSVSIQASEQTWTDMPELTL